MKASTAHLYRSQWNRLVKDALGHRPIDRITEGMVADWRASLDPEKHTQRRQVYALVRQVFSAAQREKLVADHPAPARANAHAARHEVVILSPAEIDALAAAMPERLRALVLLSAWCALRQGEALALQRHDVDIERGTVTIRRGAMRVNGAAAVLTTPKTRGSVRTVAVPPHIVQAVADHLELYVGPGEDALLFPGMNGRVLAPVVLYSHFYPAREAIGHPTMHWHDLRHSGGTLAAQTGATLREIQDRLGHSTVGAAMRYQHAAANRQTVIASGLSALAGYDETAA